MIGQKYRLIYTNSGYSYSINKKDGKSYISFLGAEDENEKQFLPKKNLIIALPQNSHPSITVNATKQNNLLTEKIENIPFVDEKLYTIKGYFWIDNYYCVSIVVNPLYSVRGRSQLSEIKEFYVDIEMPQSVAAKSSESNYPVSTVIDNPQYGSQWKSQKSSYSVVRTDSWIDYSADYIKLGVAKDGIYRLRYNDLQSYGVPVSSLNPNTIKIYLKGKEIPIYVYGENDGKFDQGDYIEFLGRRNYGDTRYREVSPFGTSYYEYLNRYSDTTIYWLNWSGSSGQRIDTVTKYFGGSADTLRYSDELLHSEKNQYWDYSLDPNNMIDQLRRNDPAILENETWGDNQLFVGKYSAPFSVSDLYPNKPARAFVKLQDYASDINTNSHNLALSINNTSANYDSGFINKYQVKILKANFTSLVLLNGINTVDIHSFPTANTINSVYRDWYELEYPRYLKTTNDSLSFVYNNLPSQTVATLAISGLSDNIFSLYRFRLQDSSIIKITNFVRSVDTLKFVDTVANGTSYFLLREDKIPAPIFYYKKKFVNLRSATNKADYIAITHPYFLSAGSNYISFIASTYGVTAKLINIFDIYDEFNYGFFAPEPIKEFLKATQTYWQSPNPKYVLLLGKGTYDFYGNKTRYFGAPPTPNFVPPYGNPVSDTWFVQWDSTGSLIPQMSIGRIPAKNIDEFQSYALKHQKYVEKGFDDWNKRFLFFAGGTSTDLSQITQCKSVNDFIINNYASKPPTSGLISNFYKTLNPFSNYGPYSQDFLKNSIDQGGLFICYVGHSGTETWDNGIVDISQLSNIRDRNPMISDFGCSTAKFAEADVVSFSEHAVTGLQGQAIAYIGNSSLGFTSTAFSFPQLFYKKLLIDTSASLGDIHRLAKIDYIKQNGSSDTYGLFIKTNTLIGDPIIRLPIPQKPNISFTNTTITVKPERPTEQTNSVIVLVNYFNLGTVVGDSVEFLITDSYQGVILTSQVLKRSIPTFSDSLLTTIFIKNKPGEHTITITADPTNKISEIYKNDNSLVYHLLVASSSIRNMSLSANSNQTNGEILFINPSISPVQSQFTIDISLQSSFAQTKSYQVLYDTLFTRYSIDASYKNKRIWVRPKFEKTNNEGLINSFYYGNKDNILWNDNYSFSKLLLYGIDGSKNNLTLDTNKILLSAISAGFNDGRTAVISKNGQNYIPVSYNRGHHVCLFDAATLEFISYNYFNLRDNASVAGPYKAFIDTLTAKYIVVIAISEEGQLNLTQELKTSIKSLGSIYIDSVTYRGSWALIGRKGAIPGSVPEKYTSVFEGRVQLDSIINAPNNFGSFETEAIGPVTEWKNMGISYKENKKGNISLNVLGIATNNSIDTLKQYSIVDSVLDISSINAKQYPSIKLVGKMQRGVAEPSPSISSIEVNYNALPELGTNYQTVRLFVHQNGNQTKEIFPGDSILQGESVDIVYRVYNVGGVPVKNVGVVVQSIWDNNNTEPISNIAVDSIGIRSYKEIKTSYNTSLGYGRRSIQLSIDPDTLIREIYRDNNFYSFPFVIKKVVGNPILPNLFITQNGVSSIPLQITDETDTARFSIIYGNSGSLVNDSLSIQIKHFYQGNLLTSQIVRRKYPVGSDTVILKIPILKNTGEHQLSVDLDYNGLIVESNESDNLSNYYFTVATTDFKIIHPAQNNISAVNQAVFLNPTQNSGNSSTVSFELDTLPSFTSSQVFSKSLQQFTTIFPLPGLKKSKRYYWRIKIINSGRDWTTGSFYCGDSTSNALGQLDSVSWKQNTYLRTAYSLDSGAKIIDTKIIFKALSAGFNDGNTGSVEINGNNVITPNYGIGHNIVVIDTNTFEVLSQRRFDIATNPDESDSLTQFILAVPNGLFVIDVVVNDGSNNLKQSTRNGLKTIGSKYIDQLSFRDSWSIIGRKGASIGSVPETYKQTSAGSAVAETTIIRNEKSGIIVTPLFGPFTSLSTLSLESVIPAGSQLKVQFVGISKSNSVDTLVSGTNQNSISLSSVNTKQYQYGKLVFQFSIPSSIKNRRSAAAVGSPIIKKWMILATPSTELAVSSQSSSINRNQVMEGETIEFTGKMFNISTTVADSVTVQLKTTALGIDQILKQQRFINVPANDSVPFSFSYNTRGKKGSHAFTFEIDPSDSVSEQTKSNNSVTIPYIVKPDTVRPTLQITFDGAQIVDGDYVGKHPEIKIRYSDNNPSNIISSDTSNFKIKLNNVQVPFINGTAELMNTNSAGKADIRWTPELVAGENIIQISAKDIADNYSDTILVYVNVANEFRIMDIFNLPNPFNSFTHFTFNLAGPTTPDEVVIKIYTVAGRLIQEISTFGNIGFNKIPWDGRDKDGDQIGNGVYLYKVIVKQGGKQIEGLSKLVKMR